MEELLDIAESHADPVVAVTDWVFKKNVELAMASPEETQEFLSGVFKLIAAAEPRNRNIAEWDRIRVILTVSAMSLFPSVIPPISIKTNYGPLFGLLLVLHSLRSDRQDLIKQCQEAYHKGLVAFEKGFGVKTFYSLPPCYYLQTLPMFLRKYMKPADFTDLLTHFFSIIPNVDPASLNINFIVFSTEMFRLAARHMFDVRDANVPKCLNEFCRAYLSILRLCAPCPSIVLLNLLHPWYAILNTTANNMSLSVGEQTDFLTHYCDIVARGKHHELHRTFPWHILIRFFKCVPTQEQKSRVLALLCHAFRSVLRLESLPQVSDSTKEVKQYIAMSRTNNSESWEISYVLASCESTLSMGISDLKQVWGVKIDETLERATKVRHWVSFADQVLDGEVNRRTDTVLGSWMEGTAYPTIEEANEAFDTQIAILNQCRMRLMTVITFQFVFIESVLDDLNSSNKAAVSLGLNYMLSFVKLYLKIMIYASHRIAMLQQFNNHEYFARKGMANCNLKLQTLNRIPEFVKIFQRYIEYTQRIPAKFYGLLAHEMAQMILRAHRKGVITMNFVKAMTLMHANTATPIANSLFGRVMSELMQISSVRLGEVMSHSANQVRSLYEWILLVIRIGLKSGKQYCDPSLLVFLWNYCRLVFSSVIGNIKKISLHSFAMKIVDAYIQTMTENTFDQKEAQENLKPLQRLKGSTFEDIQTYAKWSSLSTFMQVIQPDNDTQNISALLSLAEMAFQTRDSDLIKKASLMLFALLSQEKGIDTDTSRIYTLFRAWFSALRYASRDVALRITTDISSFLPVFAHPQWLSRSPAPTVLYKPLDIDISPIINEIGVHVGDSDMDAANLFGFVTWAFEGLKENMDCTVNELRIPEYQLLSLLLLCSNYPFLETKVKAFCQSLVEFYGDAYVNKGYDLFILNVMAVAGKYRSENTRFAIDLAISFLKYVKERDVKRELVRRTVDESIGFFQTTHRIFSITISLSLFLQFFPECVTINHIRTILISSNTYAGFDREFIKAKLND